MTNCAAPNPGGVLIQAHMFTASFMKELELERWENPSDLQIELNGETRRLVSGGPASELAAIYRHTPYNSERTQLIYQLSEPRIRERMRKLKMAKWELVICAHNQAVSFSLRASENLNEFKEQPYADELVPIRLFWDE